MMKTSRNPWLKGLSLLLSLLMCLTLLPLKAAKAEGGEEPEEAAAEEPIVIRTADGEIAADEDWNEVYPFGTFAFGNHQADVAEPGTLTAEGEEIPQSVLIPVYRLGGTVGRVTATIAYAPAITTGADGNGSIYDYSASGKQDLLIEYENPNPLAPYQDLGIPLAERRMTTSAAAIVVPEAPEDAKAEDELKLTLTETADSFRWQVKKYGA